MKGELKSETEDRLTIAISNFRFAVETIDRAWHKPLFAQRNYTCQQDMLRANKIIQETASELKAALKAWEAGK